MCSSDLSGGVTLSSQAQAQIIACLEKLDFILANQIRLERILLSRGMIDSSESGDTSQENAVNA